MEVGRTEGNSVKGVGQKEENPETRVVDKEETVKSGLLKEKNS